jgi:hypothetical protein
MYKACRPADLSPHPVQTLTPHITNAPSRGSPLRNQFSATTTPSPPRNESPGHRYAEFHRVAPAHIAKRTPPNSPFAKRAHRPANHSLRRLRILLVVIILAIIGVSSALGVVLSRWTSGGSISAAAVAPTSPDNPALAGCTLLLHAYNKRCDFPAQLLTVKRQSQIC